MRLLHVAARTRFSLLSHFGVILLWTTCGAADDAAEPEFCLFDICGNGGSCSEEEVTIFGGYKEYQNDGQHPLPKNMQNSWNHCNCRPGYSGAFCEIKLHTCKKKGDKCSNGMECVKDFEDVTGNEFYHCGCDGTQIIPEYAEHYCGHLAINYCGSGHTCANAGKCTILADGSPGCECTPGWTGDFCNHQGNQWENIDYTQFRSQKKRTTLFGLLTFAVLMVGVSGYVVLVGVRNIMKRSTHSDRIALPHEKQHLPIDIDLM